MSRVQYVIIRMQGGNEKLHETQIDVLVIFYFFDFRKTIIVYLYLFVIHIYR